MAKVRAKVSRVKEFLRLRKQKQKSLPPEELKDPVERMRYAYSADAKKSSSKKMTVNHDEEVLDPVTKIRSAGY
jgi:hypothetical protein